MKSLVEINDISNVLLSSIYIKNNYAASYFLLNGTGNGNINIKNTQITDNTNNGPESQNVLFEGNNFINTIIINSDFINNNKGTHLFIATLSGLMNITNSNFINNNVANSIMSIDGMTSLSILDVIINDNTAINGILFTGSDSGDVDIYNFQFINNNWDDLSVDGQTLIQFDYFSNVNIDNCDLSKNDGDYLFTMIVNGSIEYNNCNIYNNDIDITIISITETGIGDFTFINSNIFNNYVVNSTSNITHSMQSLVEITDISNVLLSTVNIMNNYAASYFLLTGSGDGNINIKNTQITDNTNNGPISQNILFQGNSFVDVLILNSNFINNTQATDVFVATLSGSMNISNSNLINNYTSNSIITVNGMISLSILTVMIKDNTAINGILFTGSNVGDIYVYNFQFINNNWDDISVDGQTLIQFNNFDNVDINNCDISMNDGDYLFLMNVTGDIDYNYCYIYNNDIDITIISITQTNNIGDFTFQNSNITDNSNLIDVI